MLGVNDVVQEIFDLDDAAQVLAFTEHKKIGSLSFWDANRDFQCEGSPAQPNNFCSGVPHAPNAFAGVFTQFPSPAVAADINGNGRVDGADLAVLLGAWNTASAAADLNRDEIVNGADLAILLGAWTGG